MERIESKGLEADSLTHWFAKNVNPRVYCQRLREGANNDAEDKAGHRLLYSAAIDGHVKAIKVLLGIGANTEVRNSSGWTQSHIAAQRGHVEIVKMLLEGGGQHGSNRQVGGGRHS